MEAKRVFDVILSACLIILFSPVFFVIAVTIAVNEGFPIIFKQERAGLNGRVFKIIKFRTMTNSADSNKGTFDAGSSARVTKSGKMLRKTKLDEIPQLFNVLVGDMSVVGPRPEILKWTCVYPKDWKTVLTVRPGITDPASIAYRHEEDILSRAENPEDAYRNEILPKKLSLYKIYVANNSLYGDIKILFNTLLAITK